EARDGHPLAQLDAGSHAHAFAERPFEGRAPAGEEDDLLVAVLVGERDAGRRDLREAELADTERAQAVEQLGEVGKKDEAETGEKRMRMAELWNAGALPGAEGRLRIAAVRPDVALEDDDPRVVAGEKASRRKARHAAADGRRAAEGDRRETRRGCNAASSHVASLLQEAGRARGSRDAGTPRRDSRRPHDRAAGTAHSALRHQGAVG